MFAEEYAARLRILDGQPRENDDIIVFGETDMMK